MPRLYPLRFEPIFRRYVWGGRRLATMLGKSIGPDESCAESWEIVDRGADQSVVTAGLFAGRSLGTLVREHGEALFGRHAGHHSFPLLLKFLDAHQSLSVQVHPNDQLASRIDPPDLGKTEAWVVLSAEPGSVIYAGLKHGVDRTRLAAAIENGTCEECLHSFEPQVGDCVFLPAGAVHALGAGLVIAEIQQASDTTYRLFDWNRVGADGKPRPLHVDEAIGAIDWDCGPIKPRRGSPTNRPHVNGLIECDKFVLERWTFDHPERIGGDNRFHVLAVLEGTVSLESDASQQPLARGSAALIPAECGPLTITPEGRATLLDIYLP